MYFILVFPFLLLQFVLAIAFWYGLYRIAYSTFVYCKWKRNGYPIQFWHHVWTGKIRMKL